MGLLDALGSDEGLLGLYLMAAGSAKPQRTSLGEGLLGGMQMMQQRKDAREAKAAQDEERKQRQAMQALQMQQLQQAMAAQQEQRQQQAAAQQRRGSYLDSINPDAGPARPMNPAAAMLAGLGPQEMAMLAPPKPKADDYKVVGGSLVRIGDNGVQEAYRAPQAPEKAPEALRTLELIYGKGSPQYMQAAQQLAQKMTTHQPGTSVSVNTGQKGLDNTLKLRGDFRSEPIYKAHQDVTSAHAQITAALKQASPAGDLAGATKIMKILDPGSVVRESELGMAMAASGLLDRLSNYAQMTISGQKLTPTQRKDFQLLADKLAAESAKQYNAKRSEYQRIAERNQLNVTDVLGDQSSFQMPATADIAEAAAAELARRRRGR